MGRNMHYRICVVAAFIIPLCVSYLNSIIKEKGDRLVEGMYYITTHIVSRRKLFLYKARMKNGP